MCIHSLRRSVAKDAIEARVRILLAARQSENSPSYLARKINDKRTNAFDRAIINVYDNIADIKVRYLRSTRGAIRIVDRSTFDCKGSALLNIASFVRYVNLQ